MSDLVENPKDRFSLVAAHLGNNYICGVKVLDKWSEILCSDNTSAESYIR